MFQNLLHFRLFKAIAIAVIVAFVSAIPAQSGYAQVLPKPGQMVLPSNAFTPALMMGIKVDLKDPFNLYFVMSNGQKALAQDEEKAEYNKLIKYFMASLVTPNNDMWVNLSPKEADRIIPDNFSMTEMGRDLLAQDYLLKQFTASLISPETQLGKTFWDSVYAKAYEMYGTTEMPIDTFNKVWITADKADIYQKNDTALLVGSHLKVMLEQDLMAIDTNKAQFAGIGIADTKATAAQKLASDIVRDVVVPAIEKEVNEGANFAQVRQAYNSMILATWFKKSLKDSLLGQVYADQSKVAGIALDDPQAKERIYQQYLQAYQTGVFDYIREELDTATQQMLPRKYFSGGIVSVDPAMINMAATADQAQKALAIAGTVNVTGVTLLTSDRAQVVMPGVKKQDDDAIVKKQALEQALKKAEEKVKAAQERKNVKQAELEELQREISKLKQELGVPGDHAEMSSWTRKIVLLASLLVTVGLSAVQGVITDRVDGGQMFSEHSKDFVSLQEAGVRPGTRIFMDHGTELRTLDQNDLVKMGNFVDLPEQDRKGITPTADGQYIKEILTPEGAGAQQEIVKDIVKDTVKDAPDTGKSVIPVGTSAGVVLQKAAVQDAIVKVIEGDQVVTIDNGKGGKVTITGPIKEAEAQAALNKDHARFQGMVDAQDGPAVIFVIQDEQGRSWKAEEFGQLYGEGLGTLQSFLRNHKVVVDGSKVVWTKNGKKNTGFIFSGKNALDQEEIYQAAVRENERYENSLRSIFEIPDVLAQRQAIAQAGLGIDVNTLKNEHAFVGAKVTRNAFGHITSVGPFFEAAAIDIGLNERRTITWSDSTTQVLKFWPFMNENNGLKAYAFANAREAIGDLHATPPLEYLERDGNPLKRDGIVLGWNDTLFKFLGQVIQESVMAESKKALQVNLRINNNYRDVKAMTAMLSLAASTVPGVGGIAAVTLNGVVDIGFSYYAQQETDTLMTGAPQMEQVADFYGEFLYRRDHEGQSDVAWQKADAVTRSDYIEKGKVQLKGGYDQQLMKDLYAYLERNKNENNVKRFIGRCAATAKVISQFLPYRVKHDDNRNNDGLIDEGYVDENGSTSFYDEEYQEWFWRVAKINPKWLYWALAQDVLGWNLDLNVMNAIGYLGWGVEGLGYTPMQGWTDMNRPLITKLKSLFGVSVNLGDGLNFLTTKGEQPLDKVIKTNEESMVFNIFLLGYPLQAEFEHALLEDLIKVFDDQDAFAYEVQTSIIGSKKVITYTRQEYKKLFQAGVMRKVGYAGMKDRQVPVYLLKDGNEYRVLLLTPAGQEFQTKQEERNLELYAQLRSLNETGGFIKRVAAVGGVARQYLWTNFKKSYYDWRDQNAYTWCNMQDALAGLSEGRDISKLLENFRVQFEVSRKGGSFNGFSTAFNAYTGVNVGGVSAPITAKVGSVILAYEERTGDKTYHYMLDPITGWLKTLYNTYDGAVRFQHMTPEQEALYENQMDAHKRAVLEQEYTEPNAVVWEFLNAVAPVLEADAQADPDDWEITKTVKRTLGNVFNMKRPRVMADKILEWAAGQFSKNQNLFFAGKGMNVFSADAQTRWLKVLGPEKFTQAFLGGDPVRLQAFLSVVVERFGVELVDEHTGLMVRLLDIADADVARTRLTDAEGGRLREGFTEVTAEFVQGLIEAKKYLQARGLDTTEIDEYIDSFGGSLDKMFNALGGLPATTSKKSVDTGFGWRALGNGNALAPEAEYRLLKKAQDVTLPGGNEAALLTEEEFLTPEMGNDYDAGRQFIVNMKAHDEQYPGMPDADGNTAIFINDNLEQIVYQSADGKEHYMVLIKSVKERQKDRERADQKMLLGRQIAAARAGEGAYSAGGVLLTDDNGDPIGHLLDSQEVEAVLKYIAGLSPEKVQSIKDNNYQFRMTRNIDGLDKEVNVTVIFPREGKEVTKTEVNGISGEQEDRTYDEWGRLVKITGPNKTTTITYMPDDRFGPSDVEFSSETEYKNGYIGGTTTLDSRTVLTPAGLRPVKAVKERTDAFTKVHFIETFEGFKDRPVRIATDDLVIENSFDPNGNWTGSTEYENKGTRQDPKQGALLKTTERMDDVPADLRKAAGDGKFTFVRVKDHKTGSTQEQVFDNARDGRLHVVKKGGKIFLQGYQDNVVGGQMGIYSVPAGSKGPKFQGTIRGTVATASDLVADRFLFVGKDGSAEFLTMDEIRKNGTEIMKDKQTILQQDVDGNAVGQVVPVYQGKDQNGSYSYDWENVPVGARFYDTHMAVVLEDGTSFFAPLDVLKKNGSVMLEDAKSPIKVIEQWGQGADKDRNVNSWLKGRVYLAPDPEDARFEKVNADTSFIYPLATYSENDPGDAIRKLTVVEVKDGRKKVLVEELGINTGIKSYEIFDKDTGKLLERTIFKTDAQRREYEETTYFDVNERAIYTTAPGRGVDLEINGEVKANVTGIFRHGVMDDGVVSVFVDLDGLKDKDGYAGVKRTFVKDRRTETGFVKLPAGPKSADDILKTLTEKNFTHVDQYYWASNGQWTKREVSTRFEGRDVLARTIVRGTTEARPQLIKGISTDPLVQEALNNLGIDPTTVLNEAVTTTTQGVVTRDYFFPNDMRARKLITVRELAGSPTEIIVGVDFDPYTGEQVFSYQLTADGQVKSLKRTVANGKTISEILPANITALYQELSGRRFPETGLGFWDAMGILGIGPQYVPIQVEEVPFFVKTDKLDAESYQMTEKAVRSLIKKYQSAKTDPVRVKILDQITALVREHSKGSAHYSDIQGKPTQHYLIPNDGRGRDIVVQQGVTGETEVSLWWFEGRDITFINGETTQISLPINILPGVMVIKEDGVLAHSMLFKHTQKVSVLDPQGDVQQAEANFYHVLDAEILKNSAFSPDGELLFEEFDYVRNRVANGMLGIQTKGLNKIVYDVYSPYALPVYGTLDEDGRLTQVGLDQQFTVDNGKQLVSSTALETAPTAPNILEIHTTKFVDGVPVDKIRLEAVSGFLQDLKGHWKVFMNMAGAFFAMVFVGWMFGKRKQKDEQSKAFQRPAIATKSVNRDRTTQGDEQVDWNAELARETDGWSAYGFEIDVRDNAKRIFEGSIISRLERGESKEDILNEYFQVYQVWRKVYMGDESAFQPTLQDLWALQLILVGSEILSNDMPEYISYLFDKSLEARRDGTEDQFGGFVRKEFTRWHNILQLQITTFQGIAGGSAKHVMPYQYYFRQDDLNDLFRTKGFVEWYDKLEYTLNGEDDSRSAIYNNFIAQLKSKVDPLIKILKEESEKNVFRAKRLVVRHKEYREYVEFFRNVQQGGQEQLSEQFNWGGMTKGQALEKIGKKSLIAKTFSDMIVDNGKAPYILRIWRSVAQVLRTQYKPLEYTLMMSSAAILGVFVFKGMMAAGVALTTYLAVWTVIKGFGWALNYLLERHVRAAAFGKTPAPSVGYAKPELTAGEKLYRGAFWTLDVMFKIAWNAFMFYFFLIPGMELMGAAWNPAIPFLGNILALDLNVVLLGALWIPGLIFFYLDGFSIFYLLESVFAYIHGKLLGLGNIRTAKDIKKLMDRHNLNALIDAKLLPASLNLTVAAREEARRQILSQIFQQMRSRDEISDKELKLAQQGQLDQLFAIPRIQKRVAVFVNSLLMSMPAMPRWEDIKTVTVMTPMYGEDVIYSFDNIRDVKTGEPLLPTALNMRLDVGFTNLSYLVSRDPDSWKALLERVEREGKATAQEIESMRNVIDGNELKGISEPLKMEIRLWASYQGQPFARTLDGLMNYARMLRIFATINHPEWGEAKIREEVSKKFQMVWAYQSWGAVMQAKNPVDVLKKGDALYLLKKYQQELGFNIEIASIQEKEIEKEAGKKVKVFYKVLSKYEEKNQGTADIFNIPLTQNLAIITEGKPGNQTHARSFATGELIMTIDMNQDFYPEQAVKLPALFQEFNDDRVDVVGYPEDIYTSGFSPEGSYHAIADRTFTTSTQRVLTKLGVRFHYGHPDVWRASSAKIYGGVSSTSHVNEDIFAGMVRKLKGRLIVYREYIEAGKGREVSWSGTDGIFRKFGMGGMQQALSRFVLWLNTSMGPGEVLAHHFGGIGFYFKKPIVLAALFAYVTCVMFLGVSVFTGFTSAAVLSFVGIFVMGQAIVLNGYFQKVLEEGVVKGTKEFVKLWIGMTPFFMAHVFTAGVGAISAFFGLAAYVSTGRGFFLEHDPIDKVLTNFAKSHIFVGWIGMTISLLAIGIWWNFALVASAPFVMIFLCGMIMPFILNPGGLPIRGTSAEKFLELWNKDVSKVGPFVKKTFSSNYEVNNKPVGINWRKRLVDGPIFTTGAIIWLLITTPVAAVTFVILGIKKIMHIKTPPSGITLSSSKDEGPTLGKRSKDAAEQIKALEDQLVQAQKDAAEADQQLKRALTEQQQALKDAAAVVDEASIDKVEAPDNVGGIDLGDEHLTINIKVDGAGMPLPVQFQDPAMINIQGLSPVIRDIAPVTALNMPVVAELLK